MAIMVSICDRCFTTQCQASRPVEIMFCPSGRPTDFPPGWVYHALEYDGAVRWWEKWPNSAYMGYKYWALGRSGLEFPLPIPDTDIVVTWRSPSNWPVNLSDHSRTLLFTDPLIKYTNTGFSYEFSTTSHSKTAGTVYLSDAPPEG